MAFCYQFPMVSATATIAVFFDCSNISNSEPFMVLNAVRSVKADAYPGYDSLPGGFLNANQETIEETAVRELFEETRLKISVEDLHLYHVSSKPGTDPRAHVINTCFYVVLPGSRISEIKAADDVQEISFNPVSSYFLNITMAFDHLNLARRAIQAARKDGVPL